MTKPETAKKAGKSMTVWLSDEDYFAMCEWCLAEGRKAGRTITHKWAMTEGLRLLIAKRAPKGKAA